MKQVKVYSGVFAAALGLVLAGCDVQVNVPNDSVTVDDVVTGDTGSNSSDTNNNTSGDTTDTSGGDSTSTDGSSGTDTSSSVSTAAYVQRGQNFMGVAEKFNRYYTDPSWQPTRTIYVSRSGTNTDLASNSQQAPAPLTSTIINQAQPGDMFYFLKDSVAYSGVNIRIYNSGTYDNPIVFMGERNADGSHGVTFNCATGSSNAASSCFNIEGADYVAVDGFKFEGGYYGVRTVGYDFPQPDHQVGVAVLNSVAGNQYKDGFFTGQSDWAVFEYNVGYGAGSGDGHGIYLSNGSDWNIVRFNELYSNASSDFQINADPYYSCADVTAIECHGSALEGYGQGISEYIVVEGNYFHDGNAQGPNFTSVRNSIVKNNVIGPYVRHGTSFWQETPVAALGSSHNVIDSNLFVGYKSHILQTINYSDYNTISNNIFLALNTTGDSANASVVALEVDTATVSNSTFSGNYYIGGYLDGHTANATEYQRADYDPAWFAVTGFGRIGHPEDWMPTASAPYSQFAGWQPVVY